MTTRMHDDELPVDADLVRALLADPLPDLADLPLSRTSARPHASCRVALDVDDATWLRARGIALMQAATLVPYYRDTNPAFAATGVRTIEQVVADHQQ